MKALDRFLQQWRIRKALRFIRPRARILDIGSVDGVLFRMIPSCARYVGIDPLVGTNQQIAANAELRRGRFPEALQADERFDAICALAVFEHIPSDAQHDFAAACARHLNPAGVVIITVPSAHVDSILAVLRATRLIDGMSLEEHHGYDVAETTPIFASASLTLERRQRFQLGLNNLFVFRKSAIE